MREIRTSGLMSGRWKRGMAEILWHRRETRRPTENTNFSLIHRATSRLYQMTLRPPVPAETARVLHHKPAGEPIEHQVLDLWQAPVFLLMP